jgi:23S rRNA (adenine2503-C2)-methyltransferase
MMQINSLNFSYNDFLELFQSRYGKGAYHAKAYIRNLYTLGHSRAAEYAEFSPVKALAARLEEELPLELPAAERVVRDGQNIKFTLRFAESVIIAMKGYKTLCVSSQTGCRWGCSFCHTGRMGFKRHLSTAEILAQLLTARFLFNEPIKNIVFMGMGEPLDNFEAVIKAIDTLTDPYAVGMAASNITLSTVGSVDNIKKFHALIEADIARAARPVKGERTPAAYRAVRLAVSLNASNNEVRDTLMPVNRLWPMHELKKALQLIPIKRKHHDLFIEYVCIPGLTGDEEHARELAEFLKDLPCVVNLIAYNPTAGALYRAPTEEEMRRFFAVLTANGQVCRRRHERGSRIGAACGQLGESA